MTPPILTVTELSHAYGARSVLNGITFTIDPAEFVCIVGPSGTGKSTLLQCLSGLRTPSGGAITFLGNRVSEPPAGMSVVFQDYSRSLMPWLSAIENVALPLRSLGVAKAERESRAREALAEVGLTDIDDAYPWQLPGGMQQRVSIARALACRPSLVIMDEPFASVDAQTRAELEDLVLRVRRHLNIAFVLVTHDIDEAVYLSDRVLVLSGRPAALVDTIDVDLGTDRNQLATKSTPAFAKLRERVFLQIMDDHPQGSNTSLSPTLTGEPQ